MSGRRTRNQVPSTQLNWRGESDSDLESSPLRIPVEPPKRARSSPTGSPTSGNTVTQSLHPAVRAEVEAQDAVLDRLGESVTRLQHLSQAIHTEIEEQDRLIDETEGEIVEADNRIQAATRRTRALIERSGGNKWVGALLCLSCILVVLFLYIVFVL
jgi:hypothetical protein